MQTHRFFSAVGTETEENPRFRVCGHYLCCLNYRLYSSCIMNKTTERERPGCCTAEIFYEDLSVKKGDWCSNHFRCWSLKNMCCDGLSACINSCKAQTNPTLSFKNKLIISEVNMLLLNASSKFLFNYSRLILKGIPIFFMRWMTKISPSALYHEQSLFLCRQKDKKGGFYC